MDSVQHTRYRLAPDLQHPRQSLAGHVYGDSQKEMARRTFSTGTTLPKIFGQDLDIKFRNLLHHALDRDEVVLAQYCAPPFAYQVNFLIFRRTEWRPGHLVVLTSGKRLLWINDQYRGRYERYAGSVVSVPASLLGIFHCRKHAGSPGSYHQIRVRRILEGLNRSIRSRCGRIRAVSEYRFTEATADWPRATPAKLLRDPGTRSVPSRGVPRLPRHFGVSSAPPTQSLKMWCSLRVFP
jgi:hypothetical protein